MLPSNFSTPDPLPTRPVNAPGASEVSRLQAQVEKLLILTETLWTILKEKHGLEDKKWLMANPFAR